MKFQVIDNFLGHKKNLPCILACLFLYLIILKSYFNFKFQECIVLVEIFFNLKVKLECIILIYHC